MSIEVQVHKDADAVADATAERLMTRIVEALAARGEATVVLTGGTRTPSDALVGPVAQDAAARINLDMLFLGVHGMSVRAGFTTPNLSEADTNRSLVAAARRLVVLADHTKWDLIGIATIAALSDAHVLVSDARLPPHARSELAAQVGELIIGDGGGTGELTK